MPCGCQGTDSCSHAMRLTSGFHSVRNPARKTLSFGKGKSACANAGRSSEAGRSGAWCPAKYAPVTESGTASNVRCSTLCEPAAVLSAMSIAFRVSVFSKGMGEGCRRLGGKSAEGSERGEASYGHVPQGRLLAEAYSLFRSFGHFPAVEVLGTHEVPLHTSLQLLQQW